MGRTNGGHGRLRNSANSYTLGTPASCEALSRVTTRPSARASLSHAATWSRVCPSSHPSSVAIASATATSDGARCAALAGPPAPQSQEQGDDVYGVGRAALGHAATLNRAGLQGNRRYPLPLLAVPVAHRWSIRLPPVGCGARRPGCRRRAASAAAAATTSAATLAPAPTAASPQANRSGPAAGSRTVTTSVALEPSLRRTMSPPASPAACAGGRGRGGRQQRRSGHRLGCGWR